MADPNAAPDPQDVSAYLTYAARQRGIDPNVASAVLASEYGDGSRYAGDQGSSFGPLQLHYGGIAPGVLSHPGLGDAFTAKTGLDARDPSTWQRQVDFGLDHAKSGGWGPWATTRDKLGISNFTGIGPSADAAPASKAIATATDPFQDYGVTSKAPPKAAAAPTDPFADYGVPTPPPTAAAPAAPSPAQAAAPSDPFADYGVPTQAPAPASNPAALDINHPQMLAGTSGVLSGVPIVGPYMLGAAQRAGAALDSFRTGTPYADNLLTRQMDTFAAQHEYPGTATAGNIVGGVAGTVPAMIAAPAAFGLGGGNLLARAGAGALTGAGIGAADTAVRTGGDLRATAKGALIGFGAGGAGPVIGRAVGGVSNLLGNATIGTLDDETANLAQMAHLYGIPVNAGQMAEGNSLTRFAGSALDKLPFSGGSAASGAIQTGVNRSVASTIGEAADKLTPDVMNAARTRIGGYYNAVAARTNLNVDPQFLQDIHDTLNDASLVLPKSEVEPLIKQAQNIISKIDPNAKTISGATYQALTNTGAPLDSLIESQNPNISRYANGLKKALDGALQRSAPQADQDLLNTADRQWASLKTIQPIVAKAPTGDVNPALLAGAVNRQTGNGMAFGWGGDLANIARIGQRFLKPPPSSGTAERSLIYGALGLPGAALGAHELGIGPDVSPGMATAALAIPGALLAGRFAGSALRSPWLANALINRSIAPIAAAARPSTAVSNLLTQQIVRPVAQNALSGPNGP